jgi:hypothetical protein
VDAALMGYRKSQHPTVVNINFLNKSKLGHDHSMESGIRINCLTDKGGEGNKRIGVHASKNPKQ